MIREASQLELERRLVGAILRRGDAYYDLPAGFRPSALRSDHLRRGFEALARAASAKRLPAGPVDHAALIAAERLPESIGAELVAAEHEADSPAFRAPLAEVARVLVERHQREALSGALSVAIQALRGQDATEDVAAKVLARLLDLDRTDQPEVVSYREAALRTLDVIEHQKTAKASVLRTGFADLDRLLKIRPTNLVVLAARPGVGKTTLAVNVADNVASTVGPVLVHSLEMSREEIVTLTLSRDAEIDSEEFFAEEGWPAPKWERVVAALDKRTRDERGELRDGSLFINDSHHNLGAICRITEKLHRQHGLKLVVVDYLQLVQADLGKGANREQVVATISRTLKLLAMRLGLPILALSQLNRETERQKAGTSVPKCARCGKPENNHRPDDRHPFEKPPLAPPQLHHLRESGAIEQDANAVLFLHNPYAESPDPVQRVVGPFELIVAKQRLGKKGRVRLLGDLKYSRFRPFVNRTEAPVAHSNGRDDS